MVNGEHAAREARPTTHDSRLTDFAHQLADAAGAVIRPYFGQALTVDTKADDSPVSIADREAEAAMRALIAATYPDHGMYGEEYGATGHRPLATGHYQWILDPIDGTRAFLSGGREWGTLIALCVQGVPVLGILDQPITGERWVGVAGQATLYRANAKASLQEVRSRGCLGFKNAEISTTSARYFTPAQEGKYQQLAAQCSRNVADGDCIAYGLLARGERDLVVDAGLKPYDILALVPIIEGAGGKITGWDGEPVTFFNYSNVLAAGNDVLHAEALAMLA